MYKDDYSKLLEKSIKDLIFYKKENGIDMIIKSVFETIMGIERKLYLEDCKSMNKKNKGNGYYYRLIKSINKYCRMKIPRDRCGEFKPIFLEECKIIDESIYELGLKLYTKGLTTREVRDIMKDFYNKKMSAGTVSRLTKEFQKERIEWQNKKLAVNYLVLNIDALYLPIRRDTVEKEAIYIVMGLKEDCTREILGIYTGANETAGGWEDMLKDLKMRGLKNVLLVISDELSGITNVIKSNFPRAEHQLCLLHKMKRVLLQVRNSHKKEMAKDLKGVFKLQDNKYTEKEGKNNLKIFIEKWSKYYPNIKRRFNPKHIENYFTYLKFPYSIQNMLYTNNWIERLNKTIRRTTKIRNSFPNEDSVLNLVGACLMEQETGYLQKPISRFKLVLDELLLKFNENKKENMEKVLAIV